MSGRVGAFARRRDYFRAVTVPVVTCLQTQPDAVVPSRGVVVSQLLSNNDLRILNMWCIIAIEGQVEVLVRCRFIDEGLPLP